MGKKDVAAAAMTLPPARALSRLRAGLVVARYNADVTAGMLAGARAALSAAGVPAANVVVLHVPGAYELPLVAKTLAASGKVDVVVALGAVVRGETDHYRYVCESAALGLLQAGLDTLVPVAFGVLTTDDRQQAERRSRMLRSGAPHADNKGAEAALAALETLAALQRIENL